MRAMVLEEIGKPLCARDRERPAPGAGQILLRVSACGVCRTDLHLVDGELPQTAPPVIPGHEIVGRVAAVGEGVELPLGTRLGVPWLGYTCGSCEFCAREQENLCEKALFTGYQLDGGYGEYVLVDERYAFPIDDAYDDAEAAPLLCAGLIGYRSLSMCGDAQHLGIYGFGAAAHIIAQVAVHQGRSVYAFTRPGDVTAQRFAQSLGAAWTGGSDTCPDRPLDAAIIFAPVGALVPAALKALRRGGTLVCGGIHMSDIPSFPYALLWEERVIRSVANLTRRDALEFLALAPQVPVRTQVQRFALEDANEALAALRHGRLSGAAVLIMDEGRSG